MCNEENVPMKGKPMGPFGIGLPLLSLGRFAERKVTKMYTVTEIMKDNKINPREGMGIMGIKIIVSTRGERLDIFKTNVRGVPGLPQVQYARPLNDSTRRTSGNSKVDLTFKSTLEVPGRMQQLTFLQ
jgi:hypothetical protein